MKVLRPVVFALSLSLAVMPEAARCGWGVDVGRASDADVNDLVHAEQALWSAKRKLKDALAKEVVKERQLELAGLPSETSVADLLVQTKKWWLENIMRPAAEIAVNPAASCAEARIILETLFEMDRQRVLLGLDEPEDAPTKLWDTVQLILVGLLRRCQEEALDECVFTGRKAAVSEAALAADHQFQVLGLKQDVSWVKDALDQCAIYKLKFESTGSVSQTESVEGYQREVVGKVVVRPGLPGLPGVGALPALPPEVAGLVSGGLPGVGSLPALPPEATAPAISGDPLLESLSTPLMGTDSSALLPSVTCQGTDPGSSWRIVVDGCIGYVGVSQTPTSVWIDQKFDLSHFAYVVDGGVDFETSGNDKVKMKVVGEDQLTLKFFPAVITIAEESHIEAGGTEIPEPASTPDVFASIYLAAHQAADVVFPPGSEPSVLSHRKDGYPVLLKHTLTGEYRGPHNEIYKDTTEFELSHQPEPKPFAPRDTSIVESIIKKIDELFPPG
jgi:hypothetical protein